MAADLLLRLVAKASTAVAPASADHLRWVAARTGSPLPPSLLQLWQVADGIVFDTIRARLLGPSDLIGWWMTAPATLDPLIERGLLPLVDDNQSNYLMVAVRSPLAERVVYVPHDDGSRLLYRSVASALQDLSVLLDAAAGPPEASRAPRARRPHLDDYLYEATGDYPADAPRPHADQEAARALMRTPGNNDEWNFAAQLLDASNLDGFATLLETDHFVRRDVRTRMRAMNSPAIAELFRADQERFEAFAKDVTSAASAAGLHADKRQRTVLQIGGKWFDLEMAYYRRHIPNAIRRLIQWFADIVAGRDPRERSDHFMAD